MPYYGFWLMGYRQQAGPMVKGKRTFRLDTQRWPVPHLLRIRPGKISLQ